ncbi:MULTISPECIES: S-layer family protein [unclassified Leptolyngbya]|uniref:beta strand repeat-containing protein n=1 Tax=unclassified Leptolyngbya TaxID=2650499 RepID=UPI001684DDD7|nr:MULTISPECIES: S-layer family protein [unclassified Leptolyngbya]MBD1909144.1 S-layer family protein [Leptolyngbya sp. FACHB-8]MBD2157518.1 S-layer family protein [Leptolyngbya sp. FACHB-16]
MPNHLLYVGISSVLLLFLTPTSVISQIIPDNTLPSNSRVSQDCINCEITGGTQLGQNLFHSFTQFSIPNQGTAYFNNALTIQNIFARVTGQNRSDINGTLRANGNANLFLLNPYGIIFGPNAALDIGGSFLATTAESINFNGFQFSATNPQPIPLLTVSIPIGLQFGANSASIINRSQVSLNGSTNTYGRPTGLQVQANQSLMLLGNGVSLKNGNLTARGGQINLVSVAPSSTVSFVTEGTGYIPALSENQVLRDISLTNLSSIDTSGDGGRNGGAVRLQGRNISLTNGAGIISRTAQGTGEDLQLLASGSVTLANSSFAFTLADEEGQAGDVIIQAAQSLTLSDSGSSGPTALGSQASGNTEFGARAGDVIINARDISIQDGSRIEASSFGAGNGGTIQIQASYVEVVGYSHEPVIDSRGNTIEPEEITSGIVSQTEGAGSAGRLAIATDRLVVLDGGFISTATFAEGNGGPLTINATDSILLRGASPAVQRNFYRSGIFVSASSENASGQVGALNITTNQLFVEDRADISARNEGIGAAGSITLSNIDRLVVREGGEIRASTLGFGPGGSLTVDASSIELVGQGTIASETIPSTLTALADENSFGDAGNLTITTSSLVVRDGAEVSVSSAGEGVAGNMLIRANTIQLDEGRLAAETRAGDTSNANIQLQIRDALLMGNQSRISAQAFNNAAGGNVFIVAPEGFVVGRVDENSDIVANAFRGRGGNITIDARSIIGLEERSSLPLDNGTNDIDASSQLGIPGSVIIIQPIVDPSQGLSELPTAFTDATQQVARRCGGTVRAEAQVGEFIMSGRGGLPSTPEGLLRTPILSPGLITLDSDSTPVPSSTSIIRAEPLSIVEAEGWVTGPDGQIVLTAEGASVASFQENHSPLLSSRRCPIGG